MSPLLFSRPFSRLFSLLFPLTGRPVGGTT